MFQIVNQANSILARLEEVVGVNQIDLAEFIDNLDNRPRTLPGLSLLPPGGKTKGPDNASVVADHSWTVMIVAKSVFGPRGHLELMDGVLDALTGFLPPGAGRPLSPAEWGMTNERVGEAAFASYVTFTTIQMAAIDWNA